MSTPDVLPVSFEDVEDARRVIRRHRNLGWQSRAGIARGALPSMTPWPRPARVGRGNVRSIRSGRAISRGPLGVTQIEVALETHVHAHIKEIVTGRESAGITVVLD